MRRQEGNHQTPLVCWPLLIYLLTETQVLNDRAFYLVLRLMLVDTDQIQEVAEYKGLRHKTRDGILRDEY